MPGSYYRLCVYVHSMSKLIPKGMKMKKGHLYLIHVFVIFISVIKSKVSYFYKNQQSL